jgi:hypothetical protein
MKRVLSLSLAVLCGICLVVATEHRAYAYVDPGSGLLALQSIAAAAAAGVYYMRRRIAALFGRRKPAVETVVLSPAGQKDGKRNAA